MVYFWLLITVALFIGYCFYYKGRTILSWLMGFFTSFHLYSL